jgi:hypothetical protein
LPAAGRQPFYRRALILGATATLVLLGTACNAKVQGRLSGGDLNKNNFAAKDPAGATETPPPASPETPPPEADDTQNKDEGTPSPPPESILDGAFNLTRTHYQTRNAIALAPAAALEGTDGAFTLADKKTGTIIATDIWSEPAYESEDGYQYATAPGSKILVLYPLAPVMQTKLSYGESVWKFSLQDESAPMSSTVTITRRDFDVFGRLTTSSRVGGQMIQGFQGGVGFRGANSLSPDGGQLTSGVVGIVNR